MRTPLRGASARPAACPQNPPTAGTLPRPSRPGSSRPGSSRPGSVGDPTGRAVVSRAPPSHSTRELSVSSRRVPGRGVPAAPAGRFEAQRLELDALAECERVDAARGRTTVYEPDQSRSVLATNQSPDVPFSVSLNPYRGCEHGCSYCYARPSHEFLGLSAGLDFETRIFVKHDAPELLRKALCSPRWKPQVIAFSGITDPYQPIERRLQLTRRCLEVLAEFRNPVGLITKSAAVARDVDVLAELAAVEAASVTLSITTLDAGLARRMEPRAAQPHARLAALEVLASAGIPAGVNVAPIVPGLTDHEIPRILEAAASAGARHAGMVMLRLPHGVKELFSDWLEDHYPERRSRVLSRLRETQGGSRLYNPKFGERMRGQGLYAEQIRELFELGRRRHRLASQGPVLSTAAFRRPGAQQLALFR